MAGFDDLINFGTHRIKGELFSWTLGTDLNIPVTVRDGDDHNVNLSTGFTASAKFCLADGTVVHTITHVGTASTSRIILGDGTVTIALRNAQSSTFTPHANKQLRFDLVVTRTSDGLPIPFFEDCYLTPLSREH